MEFSVGAHPSKPGGTRRAASSMCIGDLQPRTRMPTADGRCENCSRIHVWKAGDRMDGGGFWIASRGDGPAIFLSFFLFFFLFSYWARSLRKASVDPPGLLGWCSRASLRYSRASMYYNKKKNKKMCAVGISMERILYVLLALVLLALATLVVVESFEEEEEKPKKKKTKKSKKKKSGEGIIAWMLKKPGE